MGKNTTAVEIPKESKELATFDESAINELRDGSGENNGGGQYLMLPSITVDNHMEEATINDRKVKIRCKPGFNITIRNKDTKEYETSPIGETIKATPIKVRYQIKKKYEEGDKSPFYFSPEFNHFKETITIISEKKPIFSGSYQQLKSDFDNFTLWMVLYLFDEENPEKLLKMELKGKSRSNYWDFLKTIGSKDSSSAWVLEFGGETMVDAEAPYNAVTIKKISRPKDIQLILSKQRELNQLFLAIDKGGRQLEQAEAEVIFPEEENDDQELDVKTIPF